MSVFGSIANKAEPDSPTPSMAYLQFLDRHAGKRGKQAVAVIAAAQIVAPAVKWTNSKVKRREDFTITVDGTDSIYPDLHEWVLERIPRTDHKALIASTDGMRLDFVEVDSESKREPPKVRLRYDGEREQHILIDGHRVKVLVARENIPGGSGRLPENWRAWLEKITFTATSPQGRDAIVGMLNELLEAKHAKPGPPPLMMPSRWGGSWSRRADLPPRTLDSVILKAGQLERLVADLACFLAAESEYNRLCQPWHHGYLFHGAPGTGKTSVARALSGHFGMPTYYLPLGDLASDADLMGLVGAIEPRSLLLLEDVDVYHAAKDRSDDTDKASVAGMLNALDGVWTPHGLVTIMTTNNRDALDDALIRKGRINVDEEFTALDREQAQRLALQFGASPPPSIIDQAVGQSPADLIATLRATKEADHEAIVVDLRSGGAGVRGVSEDPTPRGEAHSALIP